MCSRSRMYGSNSVHPLYFFSSVSLSSLELSDTKVYEPYIRDLLGAASQLCEVVVTVVRLSIYSQVDNRVVRYNPVKLGARNIRIGRLPVAVESLVE